MSEKFKLISKYNFKMSFSKSLDHKKSLRQKAYQCLLDLGSGEALNASGRQEIYGCLFGRDSLITIIKLLNAYQKKPDKKLLQISKKTLYKLSSLQGQEFNIESGEQPGKIIHEYRFEKFDHLVSKPKSQETPWEGPWYIYPDNTLRSYDSLDSTPLFLIACHKYYQLTKDYKFLLDNLNNIEAAINWIISFGDQDKDLLLEYEFSKNRTHGGLLVQSWTDSHESIRQKNGKLPKYPIAPCEVQGYAWLSLKLWGDFYLKHSPNFGKKLISQAAEMKKNFNNLFILQDNSEYFIAQALDGDKNQIKTITGNPLILLWASYQKGDYIESIVDRKYIYSLVKRAFQPDLFNPKAGLRTMSSKSETFDPSPNSYHNGSIWPKLNGLAHEGLKMWSFTREAKSLEQASLNAFNHFQTPIELYVVTENDELAEFCNSSGQTGCLEQAWSAAVFLDMLTQSNYLTKLFSPFWQTSLEMITLPIEKYSVAKALKNSKVV